MAEAVDENMTSLEIPSTSNTSMRANDGQGEYDTGFSYPMEISQVIDVRGVRRKKENISSNEKS